MSTLQSSTRGASRLRIGLGGALIALGALIAVALTILFLALAGSTHQTTTKSATHTHHVSTYTPLIQYRGTGATHAVINPMTGQMHGGGRLAPAADRTPAPAPQQPASGYHRAERSYGAVP